VVIAASRTVEMYPNTPGSQSSDSVASDTLAAAHQRLQAVRQQLSKAQESLSPIGWAERSLAQEMEAVDTLRVGYEFRGDQITRMQQRIASLQAELIDLRAQAGQQAGEDLAVAMARIAELQSLLDEEN